MTQRFVLFWVVIIVLHCRVAHSHPPTATERLIAALIGSQEYFVSAADHHHALLWMVSQATQYGELKSPFLAPHVDKQSSGGGRQPFHQAVETVLRRPDIDGALVIAQVRRYLDEQHVLQQDQQQVQKKTAAPYRPLTFLPIPGGVLRLPKWFVAYYGANHKMFSKAHHLREQPDGFDVQIAPFEVAQTRLTVKQFFDLTGNVPKPHRRINLGTPMPILSGAKVYELHADHPAYATRGQIDGVLTDYRRTYPKDGRVTLGTPLEWLYLLYGDSPDRVGWSEPTHDDFLSARHRAGIIGTSPWGDVAWDPLDYDTYDDPNADAAAYPVACKTPYRLHGGDFYDLFGMGGEVAGVYEDKSARESEMYHIGGHSGPSTNLLRYEDNRVLWEKMQSYAVSTYPGTPKVLPVKYNLFDHSLVYVKHPSEYDTFDSQRDRHMQEWARRLTYAFRLFRRAK